MDTTEGLVCAYLLDGDGGGQNLGWEGVRSWNPDQGTIWIHLDYAGPIASKWLREGSGVNALTAEALLTREVRPRLMRSGDALLVLLRGVNLNPGANPEDMVGIRIWVEENRIISLRHRHLSAVQDVRFAIEEKRGPRDAGDLLATLVGRLIERIEPVIAKLEDEVDGLEDAILIGQNRSQRTELLHFRRTAIALRRYLAPQRQVMARLPMETAPWIDELVRARLRELDDRITRYVEDIDEARERAAVVQDELNSRLGETLNRNTYALTVIAALFLPPSLLTGILGVNVGGMPGLDNEWGFAITVALILIMGGFEFWILRKLKWI
jgi:zinc transporter